MHISRSAAAAAIAAVLTFSACSGGSSPVPQSQPGQSNQTQAPPQAQTQSQTQSVDAQSSGARPIFTVIPPHNVTSAAFTSSGIPTWNGSFTYKTVKYSYTMIGANPATSNATTNVAVMIVPLAIHAGGKLFSPAQRLSNTHTVTAQTLDSPIFQSEVDFNQGGTDIGTTQYEDAFQRMNFWHHVSVNTSYHTMLSPVTTSAVQSLTPGPTNAKATQLCWSSTACPNVALVNINYLDPQLNAMISTLAIPANVIPIFLLHNVYLTGGSPTVSNCCIGGYHTYNGTNVYMEATFVDVPGSFSQDVSALSHEIGEAYDDPLVNNPACNGGILEVGDPLEGESNYGGYPYTAGGFTYNLQDLVTLPYFGAPKITSANEWSTFQGQTLSVCQNGG